MALVNGFQSLTNVSKELHLRCCRVLDTHMHVYILNGVSASFESRQKNYQFYQNHIKVSEKHPALVMRTDFHFGSTIL